MPEPNFTLINQNLRKIKDAGLPFSEAERYLKREGITTEQVAEFNKQLKVKQQPIQPTQPQIQEPTQPQIQTQPEIEKQAEPTYPQIVGKGVVSGLSGVAESIVENIRMINKLGEKGMKFFGIEKEDIKKLGFDNSEQLQKASEFWEKPQEEFAKELQKVKGAKEFVGLGVEGVAQTLPTIAYGLVFGAGGGLVPYALVSAGKEFKEAEKEEQALGKQFLRGSGVGLVASATEAIPLGRWLKLFGGKQLAKKGAVSVLKKYGKAGIAILTNIGTETMQEVIEEPATNLVRAMFKKMPLAGEGGIVDVNQMKQAAKAGLSMSMLLTAFGLPVSAVSRKMAERSLDKGEPITGEQAIDFKEQLAKDVKQETGKEMVTDINQIETQELKDAKEAKKEVTEAVQKEGMVSEKPKVQEIRLRDDEKARVEAEQRKVEQVSKETIKTEDIKAKEVEQETIPKESIDRSEVKSPIVSNIDKAGVIATKEQSKQELELVDPKVTKSQEIASKRVSEILVTKPKTKEAYDFTFDEFTTELAKPESKLNPIYSQIKNEVSVKDLHKSMVKEALSKGIAVKENIVRKYDDIAIQYGYRNKNERVEQIRVKLDKQRGEYLIKSETFKNSINSKFNFTKEELRKNLSEYMKSALPLANRGKFVSKILKVKSKRSANKIFNDIQKEHNEIYRKKLVQAIKINSKFALLKRPKVIDNFKNTRDITVDYREKVRNLLNTISFTALSERKAKNLKETIKYKRQAVSLGKEINIPERVINQLVRLTQTPIKKFNIPELEAILSQIDLLNRIGNRKFTLLKDRYNAEKELIKEDLIKNAVKIDKKALKVQGNQIKKLTPLDRLSNLKNKTINFFGTTYNALMPVDYFFNDIMDSNANFDGSHYINIKKPIDLLVNEHYQFSDKIINRVRDLISKSKLKDENFRRIGVYAFRMQENGMEYLKFIGMSEDTIKSVKLNSKEMFIYKEMRKELDKIYPLLQKELRISHNRELGFIENYFPVFKAFFNADVIKSEKGEILTSESMGNELEKYYSARKNVFQGFTLTREGGKIGANINALNSFEKYITNASYFIHLGRKVKMLGEVINSKEYGSAVGTFGQDMMKTYIDLIARRGGKTGQDTTVESALRTLRRNFVSYNIGIKLSTAAVQITAALDGMAKIGSKYAFLGYKGIAQGDKDINKNTLSGNKLRKWLMDNFPKFRERVGGDPDFARSDLTSQWDKVRTNSLFMTKFTDRLTAAGIVYGAYLKSLKSKGLKLDFNKIDKEAVFEAEREMELSQATNLFTNLPLLLSAGKGLTNSRELNKSLLTFQTFNMFRFANLRRIITNDFRKGNIIEGTLKGATYAFAFGAEVGLRYGVRALMIGILSTLGIIPKAIREDEDFLKEAFFQVFTTIPGMSIFTGITRYGNSIMPTIGEVEDAIEDSHKAYMEIIGKLNPRGRSNIEKAMFSIARIFGVPISELEKVRRLQQRGKKESERSKLLKLEI